MPRRPAATLIEVLVALFVTSIGLLALLALFPLGAMNMAQAIKDSRCALAAGNAHAYAASMQVRDDALVLATLKANPPVVAGVNPPTAQLPALPPGYTGPGYPVYVDAFGLSLAPTVGNIPGTYAPAPAFPGIPRVGLSFVNSPALTYRWGAVLDDIAFASSDNQPAASAAQFQYGTPVLAGGDVEREDRYTWAYMLRRPNYSVPSVVDCTIVVYSGRSTSVLGETAYFGIDFGPMIPAQPLNTVTINWGGTSANQTPPALRVGGWILDATLADPAGNPDPHGFFYRVVSITDTKVTTPGAASALQLELQTNVRRGSQDATGNPYGVLVILDNVAEVFEKGPGWQP
jgi:type II secretory pathway pseudopilin PulG